MIRFRLALGILAIALFYFYLLPPIFLLLGFLFVTHPELMIPAVILAVGCLAEVNRRKRGILR